MLLTALYELATSQRLLDELPLQRRTLHALVPLSLEGDLRLPHLIVLSQPDTKGKQRPGVERLLPRFPGENNGGKAYFLAEGTVPLLGCNKKTGDAVFADPDTAPRSEKNPAKAFQHFWQHCRISGRSTSPSTTVASAANCRFLPCGRTRTGSWNLRAESDRATMISSC